MNDGGAGVPENSLAAFKHALDVGADMVELDVWLTRDGHVVVHHDATLARMCGETEFDGRRLDEFDYADLPPLNPADPGQQPDDDNKSRRQLERIPLLSEVVSLITDETPMIIEFKQLNSELIAKTHAIVAAHRAAKTVLWFGLPGSINPALRAFDPAVPTIASIPEMLMCFLYYYLGLTPFLPRGGCAASVLGVPLDKVDYARLKHNKTFSKFPDAVLHFLADTLGGDPARTLLCRPLFRHLRHARGVPTIFLGCNNEHLARYVGMYDGCAALTDRPRWFAGYLAECAEDKAAWPREILPLSDDSGAWRNEAAVDLAAGRER